MLIIILTIEHIHGTLPSGFKYIFFCFTQYKNLSRPQNDRNFCILEIRGNSTYKLKFLKDVTQTLKKPTNLSLNHFPKMETNVWV